MRYYSPVTLTEQSAHRLSYKFIELLRACDVSFPQLKMATFLMRVLRPLFDRYNLCQFHLYNYLKKNDVFNEIRIYE